MGHGTGSMFIVVTTEMAQMTLPAQAEMTVPY